MTDECTIHFKPAVANALHFYHTIKNVPKKLMRVGIKWAKFPGEKQLEVSLRKDGRSAIIHKLRGLCPEQKKLRIPSYGPLMGKMCRRCLHRKFVPNKCLCLLPVKMEPCVGAIILGLLSHVGLA